MCSCAHFVHHSYTHIFCNFIEGALRKLVDLGKLKREGLCDDILSIFPNSFRRERVI